MPAFALRPVRAADSDFLFALFADTRADALYLGGADPQLLAPLLRMQYAAQRQHYAHGFPGAAHAVITGSAGALGQCLVQRTAGAIHLIDVSVVAAQRARGVGTALLRTLQAEAAAARVPLRLQVARGNRALAWYRRLGFAVTAQDDMNSALEWRAHHPTPTGECHATT